MAMALAAALALHFVVLRIGFAPQPDAAPVDESPAIPPVVEAPSPVATEEPATTPPAPLAADAARDIAWPADPAPPPEPIQSIAEVALIEPAVTEPRPEPIKPLPPPVMPTPEASRPAEPVVAAVPKPVKPKPEKAKPQPPKPVLPAQPQPKKPGVAKPKTAVAAAAKTLAAAEAGKKPAASTAAGKATPAVVNADSSYANRVRQHLARFAGSLPPGANGEARVQFVVQPDGQVTNVQLVKLSGHAGLDSVALNLPTLAQPLPLPGESPQRLEVPVQAIAAVQP
ncbi:MAG: TonB family protein [Pseudomonadota bacterium]